MSDKKKYILVYWIDDIGWDEHGQTIAEYPEDEEEMINRVNKLSRQWKEGLKITFAAEIRRQINLIPIEYATEFKAVTKHK